MKDNGAITLLDYDIKCVKIYYEAVSVTEMVTSPSTKWALTRKAYFLVICKTTHVDEHNRLD